MTEVTALLNAGITNEVVLTGEPQEGWDPELPTTKGTQTHYLLRFTSLVNQ